MLRNARGKIRLNRPTQHGDHARGSRNSADREAVIRLDDACRVVRHEPGSSVPPLANEPSQRRTGRLVGGDRHPTGQSPSELERAAPIAGGLLLLSLGPTSSSRVLERSLRIADASRRCWVSSLAKTQGRPEPHSQSVANRQWPAGRRPARPRRWSYARRSSRRLGVFV